MNDKITDLNEFRNAKTEPDAEFVFTDEFGRKLYTFLLDYEMDGKTYTTRLVAYDEDDADRRIAAMRESLVYGGKIYTVETP